MTGLFFGHNIQAQGFIDYAWVDARMNAIPSSSTFATGDIAGYITANFTTPRDKVRAAYSWVTSNIHYNKDSMFYRYWGDDPERKLSSVLKTRKGVCEDYANLLVTITSKCGIPGYVVTGYCKIAGKVNTTGHSWCAIKVEDEWLLCDPTWDAPNSNQTQYFLVPPAQFIATHFPFDPLWQLVEYPLTAREFKMGRNGNSSGKPIFHFKDSADQYLLLDTLQQKEATAIRLLQTGLADDDIRTWYSYNNMKIRIVREESDMETFNAAVAACNKAKALYNDLVSYRNNQFKPNRTEASISSAFATIELLLAQAGQQLRSVGSKTENYQYDTEGLQATLNTLQEKTNQQKRFFTTYFAGSNQPAQPRLTSKP